MVERKRFALNRIICPNLEIDEFFKLAADVGLKKVELRNDLPGKGIIDGLSPALVGELADQYGIEIITINALQKFNLHSIQTKLVEELQGLLDLSGSIRCRGIVLCPNNVPSDDRSADQIRWETIENLKSFAPLFEDSGLLGLVEPLGLPDSSLGSLVTAMEVIRKSSCSQYRIVHDSFHHFLGPDTSEILRNNYDIIYTGLVHLSGVNKEKPIDQFRDEDRILVGPNDRLKNREQVNLLVELGYKGDFSFEPFASEIHSLPIEDLKSLIDGSIEYLLG